jgi:hypothetical protein
MSHWPEFRRRNRDGTGYFRSSRAMTMRWIWFVPSKICGTFASRM